MKLRNVLLTVLLVLLLGGGVIWAYETLIYTEQGGAKMVIASGGEIEFQSGSVFDMQSNMVVSVPTAQGTATPGLYIDNLSVADSLVLADSGTVVAIFQDDGALNSEASIDAALSIKAGAATPVVVTSLGAGDAVFSDDVEVVDDLIVTGAQKIGLATPVGITWDDDDLIVNDDAEIISDLHVQGNQYIGEPTPVAITMDGDDLIVADDMEIIGTGYFAGAVEMDSTLDMQGGSITLQNDETIGNAVDNAVTVGFAVGTTTFYGQPVAAASGDGIDLTQTLLVMDGSDVYSGLDMNLTNADQTGTSHVRGIDLNLDAADAQATESAAYIGGVWDYGVHLDDATLASGDMLLQNSLVLDGYTADNFKVTDGINTLFTVTDAGTTGNGDFSGTLTVDGISTLTGAAALNGGITVDSTAFTVADTTGNVATTGSLTASGAAALNGGITVDTSAFTVADTSGNVATTGTLVVSPGSSTLAALTVTDTLAVTGNATLSGDVTIDDDLVLDPQAITIAVTADSTITALGTVTKLSAAASCGTATITAGTAGQVLILMGPAANTITITDTGTLKLSGNCALTANGTLTMISDGTNWNEISCNDNG